MAKNKSVENVAIESENDNPVANHGFLSKEVRDDMIARLEKWGVDTKNLTDDDLLKALTHQVENAQNQVVKNEAEGIEQKLNHYASGSHLSKSLLKKLFFMNVPKIYLDLFNDQDEKLIEEKNGIYQGPEIWTKIRTSGIRPIKSTQEIYKDRSIIG